MVLTKRERAAAVLYVQSKQKEKRLLLAKWLSDRGCSVCSFNKSHVALHPHHPQFEQPSWYFEFIQSKSPAKFQAELDKCLCLCLNCQQMAIKDVIKIKWPPKEKHAADH